MNLSIPKIKIPAGRSQRAQAENLELAALDSKATRTRVAQEMPVQKRLEGFELETKPVFIRPKFTPRQLRRRANLEKCWAMAGQIQRLHRSGRAAQVEGVSQQKLILVMKVRPLQKLLADMQHREHLQIQKDRMSQCAA